MYSDDVVVGRAPTRLAFHQFGLVRRARPALIVQVVDTTTDRETTPTLRQGVDQTSSQFVFFEDKLFSFAAAS
jgi:hypothetical protein